VIVPTCDGRCCAVFPLPAAIPGSIHIDTFADGYQIGEMVRPLTLDEATQRYRALDFGDLPQHFARYFLFTCRNWDETTHLCTVYDTRPAMCSDYPYDLACDHCGYQVTP
jgi:Fe-S-cluster containining protein